MSLDEGDVFFEGDAYSFGVRWQAVFCATPLSRYTGQKALPPPAAAGLDAIKWLRGLAAGSESRRLCHLVLAVCAHPFKNNEAQFGNRLLCILNSSRI